MLRSARSDNRPADVIGNAVQVMRVATGGKVSETFAPPHAALPTTAAAAATKFIGSPV